MSDTPQSEALPRTLTRPLWGAALCFGLLLGLFGLWSVLAPIATTVRVSGMLKSSLLTYEIQHPFGGQLAAVHIRQHDPVSTGTPLFRLDVEAQKLALHETQIQIQLIEDEIAIIGHFLDPDAPSEIKDDLNPTLFRQYEAEAAQIAAQIEASELAAAMANSKLLSIDQQLEILDERLSLLTAQADRQSDLRARGIATQAEADTSQDQALMLQAQIETQYVEQITLHSEIVQAQQSALSQREDHKRRLLSTLNTNKARLPELRRQAGQLQREIDMAIVRAPVDGTVVDLTHATADMVATRGQTLARLAQPLDDPIVDVLIPTGSIDQVYTGMTGLLTISALPQRDMPVIEVELTSISPEALRNPDGNPTRYPARAKINADDLKAARKSLGAKVNFASDMPVSVAFSGRSTTFGAYLFGGFLKVFQDGLQD